MFIRSGVTKSMSVQIRQVCSLAVCYIATTQLPAMSALETNAASAAASSAPSTVMLQEAIIKSRQAKTKHVASPKNITKTDHVYYLVYTSAGQTARGDFSARKIFINGEAGSIVATDGIKVKVITGQAHFFNEGATSLTIMDGVATRSLEPGQQADIGKSLLVKPVFNSSGTSEGTSPADSVSTGQSSTIDHKPSKSAVVCEPARVWAEENCQFGVNPSGTIELLKGQIIVSSSESSVIHTLAGTVDCAPLSMVSVRCSEAGLAVENASYFRPAKVRSHGHTISVEGGRSVVLVSGAPDAQKVPVDGVERRQLYASFDGYMTVLQSEFKMTSLIKRYRSLRLAMNQPISPFEKTLVSHWVKDIAVYSTMHGEPEDFCEKPEILAVTRLGQFFNPFYGN